MGFGDKRKEKKRQKEEQKQKMLASKKGAPRTKTTGRQLQICSMAPTSSGAARVPTPPEVRNKPSALARSWGKRDAMIAPPTGW